MRSLHMHVLLHISFSRSFYDPSAIRSPFSPPSCASPGISREGNYCGVISAEIVEVQGGRKGGQRR